MRRSTDWPLAGRCRSPTGTSPELSSAGVFTTGHVGPEGLDELVRICRPGGVIVVTVKDTRWQGGFAERVGEFEAARRISRLAEETEPYVSMPGEAGTVPSRAVALRVL